MKNSQLFRLGAALAVLSVFGCSTDQPKNELMPKQTGDPVELAYPQQPGTLRSGTFRGEFITYRVINGEPVYQGDMMLSPSELMA